MHDYTVEYLNHAFFDSGEYELKRSDTYNDVTSDWANRANLDKPRPMAETPSS